jgi:tRNA threonylcarbamoyladenosine biosynthesis protein TsaE
MPIPTRQPGHRPILGSRHQHWPDEAACAASAGALAQRPGLRNAFVELHGPLGAGKTTFARHLLQALGVKGRVKSPTYALMEPYELPGGAVWHFDFYRFNDPLEWEDAGFRDIFASAGMKLVEWPEKAAELLPTADLEITISAGTGTDREVDLHAHTELGRQLL